MTPSEKELRELDAWIAEHVMGWRICNREIAILEPNEYVLSLTNKFVRARNGKSQTKQFEFTTDPAAAMLVLEKCFTVSVAIVSGMAKNRYYCSNLPDSIKRDRELSETFPLAICLMAKSLFSEEEK